MENAIGKALRWTDDELVALSKLSPEDAAAAVTRWQSAMAGQYRQLILAGTRGSAIGFDADRLLYTINGRTIAPATIKKATLTASQNWGKQFRSLTEKMTSGEISIPEWQAVMSSAVKEAQTAMTIMGKGGIGNVTLEDAKYLEGEMKFQNERLARFALQVERGEVSPKAAESRSPMYAEAANPTYEDAAHALAEDAGFDEERRILGAAEHCDGCMEQSAMGWQPLGTLDAIGDEECQWNCHCHFEYRKRPTAKGSAGKAGGVGSVGRAMTFVQVAQTVLQTYSSTKGRGG